MRLLPSRNDLPLLWDGRVVEWRGWSDGTTTMALHNPKERCTGCGSSAEPAINAGIMDAKQGEMVEHEPLKKTKSGRTYRGRTILVPANRWARLFAFRCPDCQQDEVWDKDADEWWTLDESDYGSDGSTDPRLF